MLTQREFHFDGGSFGRSGHSALGKSFRQVQHEPRNSLVGRAPSQIDDKLIRAILFFDPRLRELIEHLRMLEQRGFQVAAFKRAVYDVGYGFDQTVRARLEQKCGRDQIAGQQERQNLSAGVRQHHNRSCPPAANNRHRVVQILLAADDATGRDGARCLLNLNVIGGARREHAQFSPALAGAALSATNAPTQLISFAIGDDQYGVDIMAVREIKGWTEITHLPKQPDYVRGVLNLRGVIVPIIDLRCRFGQGLTEATPLHIVIIVQIGAKPIGLLADRVLDIVSLDESQIQPVPRIAQASRVEFLSGLVTIEGAMIALIDLPDLLSLAVE